MAELVQTVLGPIAPDALGITLSHEHLLCDQRGVTFQEPADEAGRALARQPVSLEIFHWIQYNWAANLDNLVLDSESTAIDETRLYAQAGGRTIVDCTTAGLGRDPEALVRIARATGVQILMGCGYYVAPLHPPQVSRMTEDDITREIIRDMTEGVGDTAVKAGFIGEIGSSWPLVPAEAKVFRAAAAAQATLGCALSVHPGRHPDSPFQLIEILRAGGADLRRVIISHIERTVQKLDRLKALADTGCYLEYDLFGCETTATFPYQAFNIDMPSDAQRLDLARALIDAGYGAQLLFAHDVCTKHRTRRYGGPGYTHVVANILPWMRRRGFTEAEIRLPVIDNPRRAFAMPAAR